MKKSFLFLVVAFMALPALQAQEFFRMGAKAGLNFSNLVGDIEDAEMQTSFHLGLVAEIPMSENFYFGPEILYSIQGASFSEEEFESSFRLDYIQIPLMARYYVSQGFNIEAGPQIGFLTSSDVELEGIHKDYMNSFDYSVNFGLGYKLPGGIFFQGRYNLGLANVFDSEVFGGEKVKNSVIQLSVGYMF